MAVAMLRRWFGGRDPKEALIPLYTAIVAQARDPRWYRDGGVADTLDGRFDMVAAITALVLLRFEADGERAREASARLTELFIDDMDGQLRQEGIGDVVVGKYIGKMMSALGGRITAYRDGLAAGGDLEGALVRNLYRGERPGDGALAFTAARMRALAAALANTPLARVQSGELPQP